MKDIPLTPDHQQVKTIIFSAHIDKDILPLVNWLNSLDGIMTRWSCEGDDEKFPPYITIWVETLKHTYKGKEVLNDFSKIIYFAKKYKKFVKIRAICEVGDAFVYNLEFSSKKDMLKITKDFAF